MHVQQGIDQQLVTRAIEVATAVEQTIGHGQFFGQLAFVGCTDLGDQSVHLFVGGQHVGENRQQLVAEVADFFVFDIEVQHAQKLAIRSRIGHQGFATFVRHDGGHGHAVVGVTTHDGVDATHSTGHLQIHVHAVVADHDHHLGTFAAGFVDHLLHVLVLDAELPVGHHVTGVGNRGVREGLANDGAGHTVDLADDIGLEHRITKVAGLDVLRYKVDLACKVFLDDFFDALHAQGEFPVASHHVYAEQLTGVDHVLAVGPQAGARALPSVTTVKQQSAGAAGFHAFDQCGQVRKTTNLAVAFGGLFEIQESQGMGLCRARTDLGPCNKCSPTR